MSLIEWRQIANKSEDLNTDYEKETLSEITNRRYK